MRRTCFAAILLLVVSACETPQGELRCPAGGCELEAPELDEVAPGTGSDALPTPPAPAASTPPSPSGAGCERPPTVTLTPADFASDATSERPCITERIGPAGCVGERVQAFYDAAGRMTRHERWVFDEAVLVPTYVTPVSTVTTYAYDEAGNVRHLEIDEHADGTIEQSETMAYDAEGRVLSHARTRGGGTTTTETVFDDEGRRIEERSYDGISTRVTRRGFGADGEKDFERIELDGALVYAFDRELDAQGRLHLEAKRWPTEHRTETTAYVYDGLGLATRTWRRETTGSPSIEERHRFDRWPDGARRAEHFEQQVGETRVSRRRRTEYDQAGREVSALNDADVDGVFESGRRTTYDAAGNVTRELTFEQTRVLRDVRYEYDAEGRRVVVTDVVRGLVTRTRHEGRQVSVDVFDLEGRRTEGSVTVLDADDRVLSVERDTDGDERIDTRVVHTYDEAGRHLRARTDWDADGVWDAEHVQGYDRAGQQLFMTADEDADGAPELSVLTSYACQR